MTRGLSYFSCIFLPCPLLHLHFNHLLNVVSLTVLNWAEGFLTLMRYINPLTYLLTYLNLYLSLVRSLSLLHTSSLSFLILPCPLLQPSVVRHSGRVVGRPCRHCLAFSARRSALRSSTHGRPLDRRRLRPLRRQSPLLLDSRTRHGVVFGRRDEQHISRRRPDNVRVGGEYRRFQLFRSAVDV